MAAAIARKLNEALSVHARHALYREDGRWYHNLTKFPGALFDREGFIVFETEREYESCPDLSRGKELNVPRGISRIQGYVRDGRIAPMLSELGSI